MSRRRRISYKWCCVMWWSRGFKGDVRKWFSTVIFKTWHHINTTLHKNCLDRHQVLEVEDENTGLFAWCKCCFIHCTWVSTCVVPGHGPPALSHQWWSAKWRLLDSCSTSEVSSFSTSIGTERYSNCWLLPPSSLSSNFQGSKTIFILVFLRC